MLPEPLRVEGEHVSFCFLISALVAPPPEQLGWAAGFDGPTAQRLLALFLLEEIQDVSSPTLIPLPVLITRLQEQLGEAGAVLARAVVTSLNVLEAPDDITNFMQGCSSLLAPPGATPTVATDASSIAFITNSSPLGLFVRRVRLGLSAMTVQALASLCGRIQQQLSTLDTELQAIQSGQATCTGLSSVAAAVTGGGLQGATSTAFKEQAVLEAYLNNLLATVEAQGQSLPASTVAAAAGPLADLQSQLPKLQYLQMAISLAHKDMHAALASLHQYFDSSGSSTALGASITAGNALGPSTDAGSGAAVDAGGRRGRQGSRGRGCHQSALHSLSSLHAALGHPQEALAALQELLRLGQQQGDEWGLLHALAGLCRVMAMSEGLPVGRSSSSGGGAPSAVAAAGSSLDLRQTEQQLQLQSLLRRCLDTAKDLRVPHIAAFAAVSLCRFKLQHASSDAAIGSSDWPTPPAAGGAINGQPQEHSASAGSSSLMVQRLLLDVATLEHQSAIAAAAPAPPAGSAAADAVGAAGQGPGGAMAPRSSDLYNPPEAFGLDVSATLPGAVPASDTASKKHPVGRGWRAAVAGVRQALATAQLVAAAALQLQGASSLAAVKLLMLLTSPGGGGGTGSTGQCASAAGSELTEQRQQQQQANSNLGLPRQCSITGCSICYDDLAACWAMLVEHISEVQGIAAAESAMLWATMHFPSADPPQLVAVQQQLALHRALHTRDLSAAHLACQELQSIVQPPPHLNLQLQLAAAEADAQLKAASGDWQQAHAAAATLFNVAAAAAMQPQAVKALLLMTRAALGAGDTAGSLPYGLSAFLHCQQLQLDGLLPEAVLLLAAGWQGLAPGGGSDFVQQLLQQVLPLGLATKSLKLRGDLEAAMAKLQLARLHEEGAAAAAAARTADRALAAGMAADDEHRRGQLGAAAVWLEDAAAGYEQAGLWPLACEVWVMLSHVLNVLGDEAARNQVAARWQAARQLLAAVD
eukprot:gene8453-8637_t